MKSSLFLYCLILFLWVSSCTLKKQFIRNDLENSSVLRNNFTGFVIYDPEENDVLFDYNGHKYFTPASNTKILTFYACLKILGDSIPGLYYLEKEDSLIFWGSGDPTFLHPEFPLQNTYNFLTGSDRDLYFSSSNYFEMYFGPGWAWDDYYYSFSTERSPFPIYGNYFRFKKQGKSITFEPDIISKLVYFEPPADSGNVELIRGMDSNKITYYPVKDTISSEIKIPFKYSDKFLKTLLEDTLKKEIKIIDRAIPEDHSILYSLSTDTLYKKMMQESDNFVAEQLLLICSGIISDSLNVNKTIEYILDVHLADLPEKPVWVDGSGLSRYNLITPYSLVKILERILEEITIKDIKRIFPIGGVSGTIENWYKGDPPYIYAKTGTLSNNHNLSGFLVTRNGRLLIFSFMHNNYIVSSTQIKREMERILYKIYDKN